VNFQVFDMHTPVEEQKFLKEILYGETRRMCRVVRYNSSPILRAENVAEHSWYVSFMAMRIFYFVQKKDPSIKLDLAILLQKALVHDMDEMLTSDIPRPFKYYNEAIRKMINDTGKEIFSLYADKEDYPTQIVNSVFECKDGLEGEIVGICDLLTVLSYVVEETEMGNKKLIHKALELGDYIESFVPKMKIECLKSVVKLAAFHAATLLKANGL